MTDLKVVNFAANAGRREEVVERAKLILKMAEEGKITDLSYAASKIDGAMITGFTSTEDAPRRMAAVSMLLHRLHVIAESQAEPD